MGEKMSKEERLERQYQEIAEAIESEGLGYAVLHGYIEPYTDNKELNEAIVKAVQGLSTIERIIEPYLE